MKTSLLNSRHIELRGVRVHNLQNIDLDLPLGKLIVITGVSGSGKSSLAFDTLYAEGQRRYVESFSTYARRFLERFEKPDADRIEPIPPAIAVRQRSGTGSRRATVGTTTEIYDALRLLYARIGTVVCPQCHCRVERHTPASAQQALEQIPAGRRLILAISLREFVGTSPTSPEQEPEAHLSRLQSAGFSRLILGGQTINVVDTTRLPDVATLDQALVVVDRLTAGGSAERLADSLELAFRHGAGAIAVLVESPEARDNSRGPGPLTADLPPNNSTVRTVDGRSYNVQEYSEQLVCPGCRREFDAPEPALFNFNSPLGACANCRGLGEVATTGSPRGSRATCPTCAGSRLQSNALAVRIAGRSISETAEMAAAELDEFLAQMRQELADEERQLVESILRQAGTRIETLRQVGLGYLTLDRPLRTLSTGEAQRVRLTAALGSNLVDVLYVLDEPTAGLHPRDTDRLLSVIDRLLRAGNTLVVVEHDSAMIRAADDVVDIGPGAGRNGGRIVFQGSPELLANAGQSRTAEFLARRQVASFPDPSSLRTPTGWLRLEGVEHHNLHGLAVDFPLGVLCAVTGVSGSGKSSLVMETLYPAVAGGLRQRTVQAGDDQKTAGRSADSKAFPWETGRIQSLAGLAQIDDVMLIDQSPAGRSGRGNPASYLNLFGEIRTLFAGTAEARVKNFTAAHFSFNTAGSGRCETCRGAGSISVDLQFLPDVVMTCPDCQGPRFRPEVLEARYRGLSIAEVLALTVGEAFGFFRGRHRLQRRLKVLKDVGLDYITLGQPVATLSGGESQRLKLASFLAQATRNRTLFVIDEPTTGLHPSDVVRLVETLSQLAAMGHSVVVIEHNLDFVRLADYLIDLGPEAGDAGGQVVAAGPPAEVAKTGISLTGRMLAGHPEP
jgi:excinuclease ABC subunit A